MLSHSWCCPRRLSRRASKVYSVREAARPNVGRAGGQRESLGCSVKHPSSAVEFFVDCYDRHGLCGTGVRGLLCGSSRDVICVDKDENKITVLHPGKIAIYEPGVDELVATTPRPRSVQAGRRCRCRVDRSRHAVAPRRFVLCLCGCGRHRAVTVRPNGVVTNSTVPIGIGDDVERIIRETNKADIVVASNPQFQREGPAIRDSSCPTASSSAPPTSAAAR